MMQDIFALFLQLCFFIAVEASPITTQDTTLGYSVGGGITGFIVLAIDVIVWCECNPRV